MTEPGAEKFASKVLAALSKGGIGGEFDIERFAIRLAGGIVFYLGNSFAEYQQLGFFQRRAFIKSLPALMTSIADQPTPTRWEDARNNVLPKVRDLAFCSMWELQCRAERQTPAPISRRTLAEELAVELAYDSDASIATISDVSLARWGKMFDEVLEQAVHNLRARSQDAFESQVEGLFISPWRDSYDAARLLLTESIAALPVAGHRLAMVPHRDVLLIADSNQLDAVERMLAIASDLLEDTRFICGRVFRLDGNRWVPHEFADGHPLRDRFDQLASHAAASNYAQQGELLDKIYDEEGQDVFVSSVGTIDHETGWTRTWAAWPPDVPTLLPRAQLIGLKDPHAEDPFLVPWEAVQKVAGHLMRPMGMAPERYKVDVYPSEGEIAVLRSHRFSL